MPLSADARILFIHGFASCGNGVKASLLRQHFGAQRLIAPDLPVNPADSLQILQNIIATESPVLTISSSLGSYYATWLNRETPIPAVLINPAVDAAAVLQPHVGEHSHWCSGERIELTEAHIQQLRAIKREQLDEQERYLVLLQQGDEVLDYRDAETFYRGQTIISQPGGNHRFEHLESCLPAIDDFLQRQQP
ncbi:MAG: YqiA/YcfP family alpha/beta fold hydrolase [Chromatiales bacterium]|jgi:predicted esterase YcpF (UPF0227 family)